MNMQLRELCSRMSVPYTFSVYWKVISPPRNSHFGDQALQFRLTPLVAVSSMTMVKIKVKLSLCLTKHHAMKAYWWSGGIDSLIL
jgi:hypothetical protein